MSKLQAVILAGGQGSRLKPYTTILPKPLIPIGDFPICEIIIRQLKFFGMTDIIISTGYHAELIKTYFGNGKRWGVSIRYVHENKPLGTAGALKLIKGMKNDFLVINGDTLTDMNFKNILNFHKSKLGIATIVFKRFITRADFGVISLDKGLQLTSYNEKPKTESCFSLGVNILNERCKDYIKKGECIGMPDLMWRMKIAKEKVFCYESKDIWFDLGRLADLKPAQEIFEKKKKHFFRG
ncbi:MAG: sugar phosphate nucleotidyltransferase [Candidatus Omnitrophota bacterium]